MTGNCKIWFGMFFAFIISSCGTGKKLQTAEAKIVELNGKNTELAKTIDQLQKEVAGLANQNKETTASFSYYRQQCEKMEAKYRNTNEILREQDNILKQLDEKLESAVGDLEDRGITVNYKRGLLFVSMEDQLLYKSGSSKLDKKGVQALLKIAGVMNDYPTVRIIVVGNTDDVLSKDGTDNWTLSTERANNVVRALRDVYKIDPARLTSAGRGKFNPVADNSTAEGRAKNRRIDIIFNPDMDKVWESIEL